MQTNPFSQFSQQAAHGTHFFFALLPDAATRAEIARVGERFRKSHRLIGTPIDPDDLHLTVCDMGRPQNLRQSLEGALLAAAAEVSVKEFRITLDSALRLSASHDGNFPFVLSADTASVEAALKLRRALAEAQQRLGLQVGGVSSYLPHVTLLRGHAVDAVQESIVPVGWDAREFVLIRSFFGQSRHQVMGRWPLQREPAPERFDLDDLPDLAELPESPGASDSLPLFGDDMSAYEPPKDR